MNFIESSFKFEEAPIAQLGEHQTLDSKVAGSILTRRRGGVSLGKTLHPHCFVLVKLWKPSQND